MEKSEGQRLDRIEEKIDRLSEALISIARFEEKLEAYNRYREDSWNRMNKFSEKLDSIELQVQDNAHTVAIINKLFWVVIVAISGAIAAQIWM
jgi:DNA-directed RNA polymerase subunit L